MNAMTSRARLLFVCAALSAVPGLGCAGNAPTSPSTSSVTRLSFVSEPAGVTRTYTLQNATFRALSLRSGGALDIDVRPTDPSDRSGPWTLMMGSPVGRGLAPGTYTTSPFDTDSGWGFLLAGTDDRFCDGRAGSVTIQEVDITPSVLKNFRASFTMQCMGGGQVHGDIVAMAEPWR